MSVRNNVYISCRSVGTRVITAGSYSQEKVFNLNIRLDVLKSRPGEGGIIFKRWGATLLV